MSHGPRTTRRTTLTTSLLLAGLLVQVGPGPTSDPRRPVAAPATTAAATTTAPAVPPTTSVARALARQAATSRTGRSTARSTSGRPVPGPYAFSYVNGNGTPGRWDPCAVIHYTTNLSQAPNGAAADVREAVGRVEAATGLRFVDDGDRRDPVATSHDSRSTRTGAGASAPVLIGWATRDDSDLLDGRAVGVTHTVADRDAGEGYVLVKAVVALDASLQRPSGFGSSRAWGPTVLHELGHAVGLAHVSSSSQLMYPSSTAGGPTRFEGGDLDGLSRLGRGGCLPT